METKSVAKKTTKKMVNLSVNYTGIRDGETLVGCNPKQTRGVTMLVRGSTYYPIDMADDRVIRDQFSQIEFFSKMSLIERKQWLEANIRQYKVGKENHLYDSHNALSVKFIAITSPFFIERLGEAGVAALLAKDTYTPMAEVYEMMRPKDKVTKANRHNLVLRPENWQIKPIAKKATYCKDHIVLELNDKDIVIDSSRKRRDIDPDKQALIEVVGYGLKLTSILYETKPRLFQREKLIAIITTEYLGKEEASECTQIARILESFTPSLLKSLLQKLVRTRCDVVLVPGETTEYSARPFLLIAFILLMVHAGSFNVNKQRFVTGLESALKRLAVIICEDSSIEEMNRVTLLLVCAMIRQQDRDWWPTLDHARLFFDVALEARDSTRMMVYETDKFMYFDYSEPTPTAFQLNASLISAIGSMSGDVNFFSYLAAQPQQEYKDYSEAVRDESQPIKMPLIHCIDQHSFTGIAHFMPYDYDNEWETDTVAPFKGLFGEIWSRVGSVNGRRDWQRIRAMENEPFVTNVRFAQLCVYQQKCLPETEEVAIEDGESFFDFMYAIDESWLTGLVGPLTVKIGNPATSVVVVIRTDDIFEMTTIRNPKTARSNSAKETTSLDLSAEEKEAAVEAARNLLRKGVPLKHVPVALNFLIGAEVRLVDNVANDMDKKYLVRLNGTTKYVDWSDLVQIKDRIPEFDYEGDGHTDDYTLWLSLALGQKSNGVARGAADLLSRIIERYPLDVTKRLYTYLANYRSSIKLYDISRDGSATKLDVTLLDIGVNHILCAICALYPAALSLDANTFTIKNGPLLWSIRDSIIKPLIDAARARDAISVVDGPYWAEVPGDPNNELFQHQKDALIEMMKKHEQNKRGHELFIDVGLGKTAIMMSFIQYLIRERKMPRYCVYSAPPSALANARSEFDRFGIPHVDVTKNVSKNTKSVKYVDSLFEPFKINIVAHDQMRRKSTYAELKRHAPDMFFVVDEFHLATTGDTIRSSIALEIARLSADFMAMTGTIVRNDNPADLIQWLEQIVDFYVNSHNYLCAFGALISKKANTGVIVNTTDVMCEFAEEEAAEYAKLVPPRMGGTANELNFRKAQMMCYRATDREMVRLICHYAKDEVIFVLAMTKAHQETLRDAIVVASKGSIREDEIFLIAKDHTIILKPETKTQYKVIITTPQHVTGYTLTKCRISIASVYPSNESTRNQYEGRMNRIGQPNKEIELITVHCGILSYLLEHYKRARSFAAALKEFAADVGIDYREMILDISPTDAL